MRYLELHAKTPQGTAAGESGAQFLDVAEIHVGKVPGSPLGAAADTGAARGVGATAARRSTGTVTPHGGAAQVLFEYGTTTGYGAAVAAAARSPAGGAPVPLSARSAGLQPSTTYHYRFVALRGGRRYEGADATFTTARRAAAADADPDADAHADAERAARRRSTGSELTADRKGMFKVRVAFGAAAPAGTARLRVLERQAAARRRRRSRCAPAAR